MQAPRIPCTKSHVPSQLYQRISPSPSQVHVSVSSVTRSVFTARSCYHLAQPSILRTTPCRLPATAYSLYSQLLSILEAFLPSATCVRDMPWWRGLTYQGVHHRYVFENTMSWCKTISLTPKPMPDLRLVLRTEVHVVAVYCQKMAIVKIVYFSPTWCKLSKNYSFVLRIF